MEEKVGLCSKVNSLPISSGKIMLISLKIFPTTNNRIYSFFDSVGRRLGRGREYLFIRKSSVIYRPSRPGIRNSYFPSFAHPKGTEGLFENMAKDRKVIPDPIDDRKFQE